MDKIDDLTRRAAEELIKEGQEFVKKRDIRYKEPEKKAPTLRPNTRFLKNVILGNMSSNNNRNKTRKRIEAGSTSSSTDAKRLERA